ncbi:MAG: hypothetical protein ACK5XV_03875 [Flavobacteriales bacterium]|jgi:hypothetical protein
MSPEEWMAKKAAERARISGTPVPQPSTRFDSAGTPVPTPSSRFDATGTPVPQAPYQFNPADTEVPEPTGSFSPKSSYPAQPGKMGFLESIGEMITGSRRSTPETRALPQWTAMPELNQMSGASFFAALGSLVSNPQESVNILLKRFPDIQVRQDEKGNFILRSSVDQKEYAIPPGFSTGDIPRAIGGIAAFTPAGRATSLLGAGLAGAGTQAAIEASQLATGGQFDVGDIGVAGALGTAGQFAQRAARPVIESVGRGVKRAFGVEPQMPPAAPVLTPAQKTVQEAYEIGSLVRQASSGSALAQEKLAQFARVNPEAKAAAERLGIELPFDVFSDNPQIRAVAGLTRSAVGSEAESAWVSTVKQAIGKADDVVQQFDALFVEGRPSPGTVSQKILDKLKTTQNELDNKAKSLYENVENVIPKTVPVSLPNLSKTLSDVFSEVGERGMTSQEKRLFEFATQPGATYGRLLREKNLIGQAISGKDSPYGNMDSASLKRLYAALAEDQLSNVGQIGGEELRRQLRSANLITASKKALEKRIVSAFGKDIDGSVSNIMLSAISSASKGDAAQFNKLMKVVPPELRKETIATAISSVSSSARAGQEGAFGFAEYVKMYRGLRANPPVYKQVVGIMGNEADNAMRDLYEVSKRITEARANVLTTGKANQALVEALNAEGMIARVLNTAGGFVAYGASAKVAGPVVAFSLSNAVKSFLRETPKQKMEAAGRLFASKEFQKLATEAATNQSVSKNTVKQTAISKAFRNFANSVGMPESLDVRIQWLQSAAQSGRQLSAEEEQQ